MANEDWGGAPTHKAYPSAVRALVTGTSKVEAPEEALGCNGAEVPALSSTDTGAGKTNSADPDDVDDTAGMGWLEDEAPEEVDAKAAR